MPIDSPTSKRRPALAGWLAQHSLSHAAAARLLDVSEISVRRYCLPFGHASRRVPPPGVIERIISLTASEVAAADFYPDHPRVLEGAEP